MNQRRQPPGVPIGGQFAEGAHDEASATLGGSTGGTISWEEADAAISYDEPTPQASNLSVIDHSVQQVAAGVTRPDELARALDFDRSEGGFYMAAPRLLGLVKRGTDGENRLTPLGERYVEMSDSDRQDSLLRLAASYDGVRAYQESGADGARAYLEKYDLSPTTVARRVSTIQAWSDAIEEADLGVVSHGHERSASTPNPGAYRGPTDPSKEVQCPECFLLYKATLEDCPHCAA